MPQFIFTYIGGDYPRSPEEGKKHFERYQQWLNDLGPKVVSPAIPFKDTHTVHSDGSAVPGTVAGISGLSIMRMDSLEEALAAAQSCPFLEINGRLEVAEMVELTGDPGNPSTGNLN